MVYFQQKSKGQTLLLTAIALRETHTRTVPVQKIKADSPDMRTL